MNVVSLQLTAQFGALPLKFHEILFLPLPVLMALTNFLSEHSDDVFHVGSCLTFALAEIEVLAFDDLGTMEAAKHLQEIDFPLTSCAISQMLTENPTESWSENKDFKNFSLYVSNLHGET